MAFDYKKAREAGYSDAEIADHLANEVGFDTKKARESGYSDAELASYLVGQYSVKDDNSFTAKLGDAAEAVVDTVKGGLTSIYGKVVDQNQDPAAATGAPAPAAEQPVAAPAPQPAAPEKEYTPSVYDQLKQKALRGTSNLMGDISSATGLEVPFQEDVSNALRSLDTKIAANKEAFKNLKTQDEMVLDPSKSVVDKPSKIKQAVDFKESGFAHDNPITSSLIASIPTTASGLIKGTLININQIAMNESKLDDMLAVPGGAKVTADEQGNVTSTFKPKDYSLLIDPNNNKVNKFLDESAQYFTSKISRETAAEALDNGQLGTWAAVVTAQQFPQLAMLIGSAVTRNPALADGALNMMGVSSAGNAYGELIKSGVPQEEAALIGVGQGLVEKYTEKMGFDYIGDAVGKAMSKQFGQQYLSALATGAAKSIGIGGTTEFGEEFSGSIGQDLIGNRVANLGLQTNPDNVALQNIADKSFSESLDDAINQGFAGMAGGGLLGAGFAYSSAKADAAALTPDNPVLTRLAGGIKVGVHQQLDDANLQAVRDVALRHNANGAAAEVISAVDAEMFRRQNMGTMERAEAESAWAQNPINQALSGTAQAAQQPSGTMTEATAAAPAIEATPVAAPGQVQENVFDPAADITPEQLPALDPEQRTAWATTAAPKSVINTLKGLPTQQARIDAVESLAISDAAKAKLHKDLGNDKVEAATFQDIDAADRQLLEELNTQTANPAVESANEQNQNTLLDLDPATDYPGYIQALDSTLAGTAERTQAVTGQTPFRVQPVSAEEAQAVTPLVEAVRETFGSEVVPFSASEKDAPDGFALNGRAHVNVANLDKAVAFVVGHEFGHTMETSEDPADQQTAQWLRENLIPMISEQGQRDYAEKFLTRGLGPDGANLTLEQVNADPELRDMLESEMVQDFLGKRMTDRKFLNELAKRDPTGFVDFVQKWIAALDNMIKSLSGKKALGVQDIDKYIKDLKQAKNLASAALIQWRANAKARQAAQAAANAVEAPAAENPVDEDGVVGEIQFSRKLEGKFAALKREKASGRYVGAPDWVGSSTEEVNKLYKKVKGLAIEGESGRFWYEKSSKAVLDLVGGDKKEAEKFVGLLAIYSQGTEVGVNTGFALEAYYQWKAGLPIKTGRFPTEQTKKANKWLLENKDWGGIKTNNFYVDLMEEINPAHVDDSHATMDMWMALAFDYGAKVLDQGPKYKFAKTMTELLAKDLGWKPHQVQAAIWTSIKTRIEATEKERVAAERKNGIQTQNPDGTWSYTKGREYDHFRLAHKLGMKLKITPEEIAAKGFDFSDALNQRMVQMSWEATPSVTAGTLPGIHTATYAQKMEYLEAVAQALTKDGKNLVAEAVGLHSPPTLFGVSAWEGAVGAGAQSFLPAPSTGTKGKRAVLPVARTLLNDYAAMLGLVLKQDAVVWHSPVYDEAEMRKNGVDLVTNRALTEKEIELLYLRVYDKFGTWEIAPGYTANGAKLLNFVEGLDNKAFQKGVDEVIESLPDDFGGGFVEHRGFRSDGEYIGNNWKENANGEEYQERLRSRRPDLLRQAASLRARVEAVDKRFSDKYNWGAPSFSRKGLDQRGSERAAGAAARTGEGSVNVSGTHFSNQQRQSLDGRYYGTGIKGAEQNRILDAKDRRLKSRLYFYVNEGKGVRPEAGVGRFAHDVDLTNLYDTSTRKLTWAKDPYGDNAMSMNNFESAVLDAGYSGYYRPGAFGDQGVAVVLGDAAIGVKPKKTPAFSRKWAEVSRLVMINEIAKNKKDWGRHLDNSQIRKVEGEDTPQFKAKNASQKLNAAYIEAAKQKDAFDSYVNQIADAFKLKAKIPGLKGRKRTVEKLIDDYNSEVGMLKDMLRATLETESLAEARELYEALREVAPLAQVSGNDKSTLDPAYPPASPAGYRDAKLVIDVNGVPAELIIAPEALLAAKELAHVMYEESRSLAGKLTTSSIEQRNKLGERIAGLDRKMAELYAPAVQRAQSSSASLRVHGTELSRELMELSGRLSGSNANLKGNLSSGDSGISATGMPSKSKNLVPSGKPANGDLAIVSTSKNDSIPQGKEIKFSRKDLQPTNAEAFGPALDRAAKAKTAAEHAALIPVANTPAALKQVKALRANSLIVGTGATIYLKGLNQHNNSSHNAAVPLEILRRLPELMADPIAIYDKAAFDRANPKAKVSATEKLYLVVLPAKVDGEYVTVALTPDAKFGKAAANFIKSVHTRAPKTLNLYTKYQVYEGITQRNEAPTSPEQFLDREPRGSQIEVAEAPVSGTDLTIRQAKGVDKPRSRNDVLALSRKQGPNPPPEETKYEAAARVAQDKFNRFKVLQIWLNDNGVKLSEEADVYLAETLMSGRISTRKEDFRNEVMGPLIQKTQKAGISMEDIADFLKMQHAQEANKRAREIQQKPDATAYGVSDKDAKAALAAYRQRPDFAQLQSLANEWRDITRKTKDILLKGGILSPEMSKAWDDTYSFYIPVKGTDEDAAAKTGTGKGLNVNGRTKMRLGHELRDEAIIENILRDHERAISLDEKNRVGKALIKFALEAQNEDIITVGKPQLRKVLKQGDTAYMVTYHGSDVAVFDSYKDAQAFISQAVLKAGGQTTGAKMGYAIDKTNDNVRVMLQASPMLADNEVNVYVGGHAVRIQINDEIAARAYTNMGVEHLNTILAASREVNNWLSRVYTGYSPDFILTNPIRDAIQGLITLTGEQGGLTAAKIFKNYPLAMKELAKFYTKGNSQLVRDYRANGGSTGGAYLSDLERIGDDIQAAYEEYSGSLKTYKMAYDKAIADGKSKKAAHTIAAMRAGVAGFKKIPVIGHFVRLMEHLNAMTENALRVATYHTLVQNGMSKPKAAAQAKNLMNFNRKGEIANAASALYLFYNPNIQGTTLIKQALMNSPHKNQARALAGSMVLAAIAVAAMNMAGDDEDKKKWEQTPDHLKDGNILITVGDRQIMITLPYGYRVFWTLGNVISDAMQGKDLEKLSIRMASSVFANFSPAGNPFEGEGGAFQLLPTSVKMALGPRMNEDSFGRPIAPKKYVETEPDSQNMNRATNGTLYASVAEKLNALSGGSKYEKGLVDVSPEVLRFWVKSLTGGTGQFVIDSINIGAAAAQGVPPEAARDIPVVRRFVRDIGVSDARAAYWERANRVKEAAGQVGQARKAKDVDGFGDLVDRKGELAAMAKFTEGMLKLANSKRDAYDAIRYDDSLSLKEKRDMMRAMEAEEKAIYDEYIAEFDAVTKKK